MPPKKNKSPKEAIEAALKLATPKYEQAVLDVARKEFITDEDFEGRDVFQFVKALIKLRVIDGNSITVTAQIQNNKEELKRLLKISRPDPDFVYRDNPIYKAYVLEAFGKDDEESEPKINTQSETKKAEEIIAQFASKDVFKKSDFEKETKGFTPRETVDILQALLKLRVIDGKPIVPRSNKKIGLMLTLAKSKPKNVQLDLKGLGLESDDEEPESVPLPKRVKQPVKYYSESPDSPKEKHSRDQDYMPEPKGKEKMVFEDEVFDKVEMESDEELPKVGSSSLPPKKKKTIVDAESNPEEHLAKGRKEDLNEDEVDDKSVRSARVNVRGGYANVAEVMRSRLGMVLISTWDELFEGSEFIPQNADRRALGDTTLVQLKPLRPWNIQDSDGGFPWPISEPPLFHVKKDDSTYVFMQNPKERNLYNWKKAKQGRTQGFDEKYFFRPSDYYNIDAKSRKKGWDVSKAGWDWIHTKFGQKDGKSVVDNWLQKTLFLKANEFMSSDLFTDLVALLSTLRIPDLDRQDNVTLKNFLQAEWEVRQTPGMDADWRKQLELEKKILNERYAPHPNFNIFDERDREYAKVSIEEERTIAPGVDRLVEPVTVGDVVSGMGDNVHYKDMNSGLRNLRPYRNSKGVLSYRHYRESRYFMTMNPQYEPKSQVESVLRARQIAKAVEYLFKEDDYLRQIIKVGKPLAVQKNLDKEKTNSKAEMYVDDVWDEVIISVRIYNLVVERGNLLGRLHVHFNVSIFHISRIKIDYIRLALYFKKVLNETVLRDSIETQRILHAEDLTEKEQNIKIAFMKFIENYQKDKEVNRQIVKGDPDIVERVLNTEWDKNKRMIHDKGNSGALNEYRRQANDIVLTDGAHVL